MASVLWPTIFMATDRDTPARSRLRTAVRRKSWGMRPGTPAALQAPPLRVGQYRKVFETVEECERLIESARIRADPELRLAAHASLCIASDDPRLNQDDLPSRR